MMKRKRLHVLIMMVVMMAVSSTMAWALTLDNGYYMIGDATDLSDFCSLVNKGNTGIKGKLTASFDVESGAYTPIGTSGNAFTGTFDGWGYTITFKGATTKSGTFGLFGIVNGGTIKHVKVAGRMTVEGTKSHIGGIVGELQGASTITGCTFLGTLDAGSSTDCIGGIVGFANANFSGSITNCFCNGTLKTSGGTDRYVGGILGYYNDTGNRTPTIQYNFCDAQFKNGSDDMTAGSFTNAIIGRIRAHADKIKYNTCIANGEVSRAMQSGNTDATIDTETNKAITISVEPYNTTYGTVSKSYVYPTSTAATKLKATASPSSHYVFNKWTSSSSSSTTLSTSNPYSAELTSSVSLYANYKRDSHKITATVNTAHQAMGSVSGSNNYTHDTTAKLTATAKTGYSFDYWMTGSTKVTTNPLSFKVVEDKTYTAYFKINQYAITANPNDKTMGTVTGGGTYDYNTTHTLTATPNGGYHFCKWYDGSKDYNGNAKDDGSNQLAITVPASKMDYTANFHKLTAYVAADATCTTAGNTAYWHCAQCDKYYSDNKGVKEIAKDSWVIPITHTAAENFDADGIKKCTLCSTIFECQPATPVYKEDGTTIDHYNIGNAGQLLWFSNFVNKIEYGLYQNCESNAKLTADIVVNDGEFDADGNFTATGASETSTPISVTPIGTNADNSYEGTFDGDGHTISGLYFAGGADNGYVGLFGNLSSSPAGTVKRLGLTNVYYSGCASSCQLGAVVGHNWGGTIENCYSTGVLKNTGTGNPYTGGICGYNYGTITNCYTTITSSVYDNGSSGDDVTNCYALTTYGNTQAANFASGEICYLLNGSRSEGTAESPLVWYQNLSAEGGDSYPVLKAASDGSNTVYCGYDECLLTYSNSALSQTQGAHNFSSKTLCDEYDKHDVTGLYYYLCDMCGAKSEHTYVVIKDYAPDEGYAKNLELTVTTDGETTTYSTSEAIALTDANQFSNVNVSFTAPSAPTYTREMASEWGTIVLPFEVSKETTDYTLYLCETMIDDCLVARIPESETIAAGTPMLVRKKTTAESITFTGSSEVVNTAPPSFTNNSNTSLLKGAYAASQLYSGYSNNIYFIYNDAFWNVKQMSDGQTVTVPAFHAYVDNSSTSNGTKLQIVEEASTTAHAQVFDVKITPSDGSAVFTKTNATLIDIYPGDTSPVSVFSGADLQGASLPVAHGVRYDFALTPVTTINKGNDGGLPEGDFPAHAPKRRLREFTEPALTGPALVIMREAGDPVIYYAKDATDGPIKLKCSPNGQYMVGGMVVQGTVTNVFYKIPHTSVAHAAVDETCGTAGNTVYWSCSHDGCDKYFSDEACITETEKGSWVIPATGLHDFNETTDPHHTLCTVCSHSFLRYKAEDGRVKPFDRHALMDAQGNGLYVNEQNTFDETKKEGVMEFNAPLVTIGSEAFKGCSAFTGNLNIPISVTSIGNSAFENCKFTGNLTIPSSITRLENDVFSDCTGFTGDLIIPNTITSIGTRAFWKCAGFNGKLVIPNTVNELGEYAFSGCTNFTSVAMNSIPYIKEGAFGGVTENKSLVLCDDSYVYTGTETNNFPTLNAKPTFSRTMTEKWGTLVVPFDVTDAPEGFAFYSVSSLGEGNELYLREIENYIAAGTPVFVHRTGEGTDFVLTACNNDVNTTISTASGLALQGTYENVELTKAANPNAYFIYNELLYSISKLGDANHATINPFHAYLTITTANMVNMVKQLVFVVEDDTTAIGQIENGELKIENSSIYNINGQKLSSPRKGINIINGKKVMVK